MSEVRGRAMASAGIWRKAVRTSMERGEEDAQMERTRFRVAAARAAVSAV